MGEECANSRRVKSLLAEERKAVELHQFCSGNKKYKIVRQTDKPILPFGFTVKIWSQTTVASLITYHFQSTLVKIYTAFSSLMICLCIPSILQSTGDSTQL